MNVVVDEWYPRVVPAGVSVHVGRMPLSPDITIDTIMEMTKHEVEATKLVSDCRTDAIMYACTASTMVRGRAYDLELMELLTEATGVPCWTTTEALLQALRAFDAQRISLATPYPEAIEERELAFLAECGIEVAGTRRMTETDEVAVPTPGEIYRHAREGFVRGSDALVVSCLALRSQYVVAELERDLGVPVITSTTATLWAGLRLAGVRDALPGWGALMEIPYAPAEAPVASAKAA
jgi:maleate isomerase